VKSCLVGSCSEQQQQCVLLRAQGWPGARPTPSTHLQAEDVQAMVLEEAQPAAILEDGVAHGRQLHTGVGLAGTKGRAPLVGQAAAAAGSVVAAAPAAIHPGTVAGACRIHSRAALTSEFMFQTSNFMISEAAGLSRGPP
jgi:hypothetical protein